MKTGKNSLFKVTSQKQRKLIKIMARGNLGKYLENKMIHIPKKVTRLSSQVCCFYYFHFYYFITSHVYCFYFNIDLFCCGKTYFILNDFMAPPRRSTAGNLLTIPGSIPYFKGSFYSNLCMYVCIYVCMYVCM